MSSPHRIGSGAYFVLLRDNHCFSLMQEAMVAYQLQISGCRVRSMRCDASVVHVQAETQSKSAICPSCGVDSKRVHSYYERILLNLPLGDQSVKIQCGISQVFSDNKALCLREFFAGRDDPRQQIKSTRENNHLFRYGLILFSVIMKIV